MKNLKTTVKNLVLVGLLGMTLTSCYKKKYNEEVRLNQALVETVITLESKLSALKINVLDAEDQLELNVTLIEALEGNNQHLYDVNLELWDLINKLNNDITILSADFEASNQDSNAELEAKIAELNAALAEVTVLTNTIDGLNVEILRLTNIINNFRTENTVYTDRIIELRNTITELRAIENTIEYVTVDRIVETIVEVPVEVVRTETVTVVTDGEIQIEYRDRVEIQIETRTNTVTLTETVTVVIDNTNNDRIAILEAELAELNERVNNFLRDVLSRVDGVTVNGDEFSKAFNQNLFLSQTDTSPTKAYINTATTFDLANNSITFGVSRNIFLLDFNVVVTFDNPLDAAVFFVSAQTGARFFRGATEAAGGVITGLTDANIVE